MNLIYYLTQITDPARLARIGHKLGSDSWPDELPPETKPFWWDGIPQSSYLTPRDIAERKHAVWFLVREYVKDNVRGSIIDQERRKLQEQESKGKNQQT